MVAALRGGDVQWSRGGLKPKSRSGSRRAAHSARAKRGDMGHQDEMVSPRHPIAERSKHLPIPALGDILEMDIPYSGILLWFIPDIILNMPGLFQ